MRRLLFAVPLVLVAGVLAGVAFGDGTPLSGSVGPGFAISVADASGTPVAHLDPGAYTLSVDDKSDLHDFHLTGPGVDVATTVEGSGTQSFSITLADGTYRFFCDAHPLIMKGSFTVGSASTPPSTTTTPATTTPAPAPQRLALTVTDRAVTLKSGASAVRRLQAGPYVVSVVDRSKRQNAHLVGAGVNRRTGIGFVGKVSWKVTLGAGKLVYRSDAKKPKLRAGTVVVSP